MTVSVSSEYPVNNITHPPRFIELAGSINFRDFGGYRTPDGIVKWRKLFRCGSLAMIEPSRYEDFGRLGITVICDLRRDDEVELNPSPTGPLFDCRRHIPIAPGSSEMLRESLEDPSQTAADRMKFMMDITRELARNHHEEYRQLFEALLDSEDGFLLHCSAGKDRTGFGAALILTALGVDEETVMEDYLLSNRAVQALFDRARERIRENYGEQVDDESILIISGVREEYLLAAFEEVVQSHGSLNAYLQEIGVDENVKRTLRRRLVTPG